MATNIHMRKGASKVRVLEAPQCVSFVVFIPTHNRICPPINFSYGRDVALGSESVRLLFEQ